jgi:phosphoribosylformimino-5-aminoimidazole carboxamide ribotide isomerase
MEIIPAIDIIDGKCVRLKQGDYSQKTEYHSKPEEVAKNFEAMGITRLHLVDLDGAKAKKVVNIEVLKRICLQTNLKVDFGGGVRSDEDLMMVFDAGASQVTCGSVAIKDPELAQKWLSQHGPEKLILGADVKNERIAVSGWLEESTEEIIPFLKRYLKMGFLYVICTDISKDGLLQGPSFDLYRKLRTEFPDMQLIASGGVTQSDDLSSLREMGVYGAIVGKAIYEGKISTDELISHLEC